MNGRLNLPARMLDGLACVLLGGFLAGSALADAVPMADGTMWQASSQVEKTAYLVGANNFMTVEITVQEKSGNPPTDEQSAVRRFWVGSEGLTLDQCIDAIDSWYEAHPDELSVPVMVIIWNVFVEKE